jgi:YD repeat-containing protein
VTTKTNKATGFKTTYSYNEVTGLLNSEKDHLGLVTKYEYDAFGRQTKATYPDRTYSVKTLQWCNDSNLPKALYYSYEEASGTSPVWTYYDVLGKEIRKEQYGFKKDAKITIDTEYNTKGQVWKVTEPYKQPEEASSDKQTYTYDDYGRIKTIVATAGTTTYDYDGLTTKTTTPNGVKEEVKNAAGQLVSSSVNGTSVEFTYWPSGLTKTATPKGGVAVETTFDLQGNKISLVDPDAGTITSKYNGFGELVWQEYIKKDENGNLKTIRTESLYDTAGRNYKTIINGVPTETKFSTTTGFVDWVKKENGHEVEYKYDGLGRVTTLTETVDGKSFSFKTTYDSFGREKTSTYPSGYSVSNYYTATGHLEQVKDPSGNNIWKGEIVNARGQFKQCLKGSKVISYDFDERGLPKTILSNGIINQFYKFKDDGNLEFRQDFVSNYKESFTYTTNKQLDSDFDFKGKSNLKIQC